MSGAKFTKGPWEWVKSKNDNWSSYDLSPGILTKDTADGTPFGDEIDRANAHLIAAAPELYRNLEEVRKWMDEDDLGPWEAAFCAEIDALLAKARGEV
ncbi:hypothetical protein V19_10 [Brucella phage V_19]|uniref:Uncharacterized protein n=31 Tax=root TaxID=1 RepID=H2EI47_9CAUD|nr:hypothetical protein F354_gp10 [Brucella phage Tb]YP_007002076.1 hypothetical protein F355_gp10 [Brucella phage Pr]AHB81070.1 hypothetical protein Bk_10 [Brucella phage Bk]AHB81126.1 hypothetical protein Fz_10 [Brucella phage Fz]AHB81184.1 hypothetical protein R/C_10 [Brucella phage R/C]AHB81240.1 hypothetical protein S708_10 [Brucella phage S708]AHB81354.1 hypothetical protein Wb_10 [Brucella phage Wb]AKO58998.1 hypothetical protein p0219_10 [Brucella phage 02_19]AKO59056.1 hypothetical